MQIGDTVTEAARPTKEPFPVSKRSSRWCLQACIRLTLINTKSCATRRQASAERRVVLSTSLNLQPPWASVFVVAFSACYMEIVQERLEREFNLDLITTAPGVRYIVTTTDGQVTEIDSPAKMPDPGRIVKIEEPVIRATILTSDEYLGGILPLLEEKRGTQKGFEYITSNRVMLTYELPLNEIVLDFYDRLKSVSRGYASLDYQMAGYWESDLVKLDVLVAGEPVDALSLILHRSTAQPRGGCWLRR